MPLLPRRTIEITVVSRLNDSPLVVIEFPAHRSDAAARSVTSTMVSSAPPNRAASASDELDDLGCADHQAAPRLGRGC